MEQRPENQQELDAFEVVKGIPKNWSTKYTCTWSGGHMGDGWLLVSAVLRIEDMNLDKQTKARS